MPMLVPSTFAPGLEAESDDIIFISVQANTLRDLAAAVNRELQSAPGGYPNLLDAELAAGGAGASFVATLCFVDVGLGAGIPASQCRCEGVDAGSEPVNLNSAWANAVARIQATAPPTQEMIGFVEAAAGDGATFGGLIFTTLQQPQAGGASTYVPKIQTRQFTLVAGTFTINDMNVDFGARPFVGVVTHGGTAGVHYEVTITPGTPGTIQIDAIDAAGALVNTDTSELSLLILSSYG